MRRPLSLILAAVTLGILTAAAPTTPAAPAQLPTGTCHNIWVDNSGNSNGQVKVRTNTGSVVTIQPYNEAGGLFRDIWIPSGMKIWLSPPGVWLNESGTWRAIGSWGCGGGSYWVRQVWK